MNAIDKIQELEKQLIEAMLTSDVEKLDSLISNELIFIDHLGQVLSKAQDLKAHQTKLISIHSIDTSDYTYRQVDSNVVYVNVLKYIEGTYDNHPFKGTNRFSRIWVKKENKWQVVSGQSTTVI